MISARGTRPSTMVQAAKPSVLSGSCSRSNTAIPSRRSPCSARRRSPFSIWAIIRDRTDIPGHRLCPPTASIPTARTWVHPPSLPSMISTSACARMILTTANRGTGATCSAAITSIWVWAIPSTAVLASWFRNSASIPASAKSTLPSTGLWSRSLKSPAETSTVMIT